MRDPVGHNDRQLPRDAEAGGGGDVDELKLGRAFVAPLADDARAANLVRSTIDLSHALGLHMVAEGVEDQATWDELVRYRCDEIQGFHLARPMSGAQLSHWLTERLTTAVHPFG